MEATPRAQLDGLLLAGRLDQSEPQGGLEALLSVGGARKGTALAGHIGHGVQKAESPVVYEVDGIAPAFGALLVTYKKSTVKPSYTLSFPDLSAPPRHMSQPNGAIPSLSLPTLMCPSLLHPFLGCPHSLVRLGALSAGTVSLPSGLRVLGPVFSRLGGSGDHEFLSKPPYLDWALLSIR